MSIENPEKPKNPHLKIVPKEDPVKENLDNKKKEISELHIPFIKDLEFCENIQEVIEIDENSRKVILDKLDKMLQQWENANQDENISQFAKLSILIRIYNQMYKFESDEDKKKETERIIIGIRSHLTQFLLS